MNKIAAEWHAVTNITGIINSKAIIVNSISEAVSRILFFRSDALFKYIDAYSSLPSKDVNCNGYNILIPAPLMVQFRYFFDRESLYISLHSDEPVSQDIYESMEQEWLPDFHQYWEENCPNIGVRTCYTEIDEDS